MSPSHRIQRSRHQHEAALGRELGELHDEVAQRVEQALQHFGVLLPIAQLSRSEVAAKYK